MGKDAPIILILDASVLINFLCIGRTDLLQQHPASIVITEHVTDEVTRAYPNELGALTAAKNAGIVKELQITELAEIALMGSIRTRPGGKRLGVGECSAIAVAVSRGYELGIDDEPAIKQIQSLKLNVKVHRTRDIMVALIRAGQLSVQDADAIKADWETNHRFRQKFKSFGELLT
jgi:predicted nucleic acid-binding protein